MRSATVSWSTTCGNATKSSTETGTGTPTRSTTETVVTAIVTAETWTAIATAVALIEIETAGIQTEIGTGTAGTPPTGIGTGTVEMLTGSATVEIQSGIVIGETPTESATATDEKVTGIGTEKGIGTRRGITRDTEIVIGTGSIGRRDVAGTGKEIGVIVLMTESAPERIECERGTGRMTGTGSGNALSRNGKTRSALRANGRSRTGNRMPVAVRVSHGSTFPIAVSRESNMLLNRSGIEGVTEAGSHPLRGELRLRSLCTKELE